MLKQALQCTYGVLLVGDISGIVTVQGSRFEEVSDA
jgi:hypothetical protein